MDLVNNRGVSCRKNTAVEADNIDVVRKVKAVVQVAGMQSMVRIDPDNQYRRDWFKAVSLYVQDDKVGD